MSSLSKQYKVDPKKVETGHFYQAGETSSGEPIGFYLSHMAPTNIKFEQALTEATRPFKKQIKAGTLSEAKSKHITMDVFIETILLGWKNVSLADVTGNESEVGMAGFNADNAKSLFKNLPDLYQELLVESADINNFLQEQLKAEAKN